MKCGRWESPAQPTKQQTKGISLSPTMLPCPTGALCPHRCWRVASPSASWLIPAPRHPTSWLKEIGPNRIRSNSSTCTRTSGARDNKSRRKNASALKVNRSNYSVIITCSVFNYWNGSNYSVMYPWLSSYIGLPIILIIAKTMGWGLDMWRNVSNFVGWNSNR